METNYQKAKKELLSFAKEIKEKYKTDLQAQRMYINDFSDYLKKNYLLSENKERLLDDYCCKLHPKWKAKVYNYKVSAINSEGYFIAENVTKTKKEAEKAKTNYLERKEVCEVKITSLK